MGHSYPECADGRVSNLLYPDSRFDDRKGQYSLHPLHRRVMRRPLTGGFPILGDGSVP